MAYKSNKFLESETAYKVIKNINQSESGNYPKSISEDIDAHKSTISDLIKSLRDEGIVKRGKRTKAQYYELDWEGIAKFFILFWDKKHTEIDIESFFSIMQEIGDIRQESELDKDFIKEQYEVDFTKYQSTEVETFVKRYVREYLDNVDNSTIRKCIYNDFGRASILHESSPEMSEYGQKTQEFIHFAISIYNFSNLEVYKAFEKSLAEL